MTQTPRGQLIELKPEHRFFIGVDSDGCVFDTMEIKQKECFCPNFIRYWGLQPVSKYAREVWEFVNLYSSTRGVNRFRALVIALRLLESRKEIKRRDFRVPDYKDIETWIEHETKLGNPALIEYAKKVQSETINRALRWTLAVNRDIKEMVHGISPFPNVIESLDRMKSKADMIVVSQTPVEALEREWEENGIKKFMRFLAGQEYGTKAEHIRYAAKGKYEDAEILMIGDAPGDLQAARQNGIRFYPIIPGREEFSWYQFYNEAFDRFISGRFDANYQEHIIGQFNKGLPERPPWDS